MKDRKNELARSLCPYTKFAWHEKRDMCGTCRAIAGKIDDYRDELVGELAVEISQKVNDVVADEDRKIGWREWLSMLYNPKKYVVARLSVAANKIVCNIRL